MRGTSRARPGQLVIQPGEERRRTSSHYTPKSLTAPIVRRTLEPLLAAMGPEPPSELILSLRICDPAMGSGAFLVEACRFLADQLVAAWTREGRAELVASPHEDVNLHARRLVAQTCLYGVDKNRLAVGLAKISLWLETMARDLPFTFLDHALRHGDSLVGLTFEQIRGFHWEPTTQIDFASKELESALEGAIADRQEIQRLAADPSPEAERDKEWLLREAQHSLLRVRLIADLIVGAFFAADRKKVLGDRLKLVTDWLKAGGRETPNELIEMQEEIRKRIPVFHWMIEFPEVFYAERPDPLDGGRMNGAAWMDAFVGNPPFMGGRRISGEYGDEYSQWLEQIHSASKNADLCAHFFRRTGRLLGLHGTIGLLATNTIAQGDTRSVGLQRLIREGFAIFEAIRSMPWPGDAAVFVSVVLLAKGTARSSTGQHFLDGQPIAAISSRLLGESERTDPVSLKANQGFSFQGTILVGSGFLLTPDERNQLITKDYRNAACISPFIGGEEVNSNPTQMYDRYVINFHDKPLDECAKWPNLLDIVREKVKPQREGVKREAHRRYWWQFGDKRPALYSSVTILDRCLVTAQVTKHLMFSFQPTNRVFSQKLTVFPLSSYTPFIILQSRIHEFWVRLLSSTMKEDLNYSASDCFDNFPFPHPDPRTVIPSLEDIGQRLYETRANYMLDTQHGLTTTYNLLKDPDCHDPRIEELRRLHEEIDRAVLAEYGWSDILVPPYVTPGTDAERRALEAFEDQVIDRLFVLNAQRAEEEKRELAKAPVKAPAKKGRGRKPKGDDGQRSLLE